MIDDKQSRCNVCKCIVVSVHSYNGYYDILIAIYIGVYALQRDSK